MDYAPSSETKDRLGLPDRDPDMIVQRPKLIEISDKFNMLVIADNAGDYYYCYKVEKGEGFVKSYHQNMDEVVDDIDTVEFSE